MRAVALNPEADVCCVSIQSLHPSKDPAFEVFEGKAFGETLSLVYPLEHFPVASPDVKIDDLHHAMSQFWHAKNLGICEATKDSSGASSKKREKKTAVVGCIWRRLRIGTVQCGGQWRWRRSLT